MSNFVKYMWTTILIAILLFAVSVVVGSLIDCGSIDLNIGLSSTTTWTIFGLSFLGIFIYMLVKINNKDGKSGGLFKSDKKKKKNKPTEQFFDSEWLGEAEMNKKYDGCTYRELGAHKDGIPLRAELVGSNLKINLLHQVWHTLIVGTTGSGKTAGYINPAIQILSATKTKPSMVISDVKGELSRDHTIKLKQEGYDVITFDLFHPYDSTRWNPMAKPYRAYRRAMTLRKEVLVHTGDNPADYPLRIIAPVYDNEWYEFEGIAYPNREMIEKKLIATKKELVDSAFDDLKDVAVMLCPIQENAQDTSWSQGAQDFIYGTLIAMLEDSNDDRLGMTEEKFNFYNLYKICTTTDPDPDKRYEPLQNYFKGRDKFSNAVALASTAINNAANTTKSYMGIVQSAISALADGGVCYATSKDDMNFSHFTDRPTALFIKVPFERKTRHPIAQLLTISLYKTLVEKSTRELNSAELPRHVYFILDEFANMPKISNIEGMLTVSRGIGISLMLVVQDYEQLNINYQSAVNTIKSNCNVHILVGTADSKTKEEFSNRCGQTSVDVKNISESKGKGEGNSSKTTSVNKVSRALITPDELGLLKEGELIISMYSEKAIRTHVTRAYKVPQYNLTKYQPESAIPNYLDEEKIFYDIRERNKIVLGSSSFDDFDFD